MIIEDIRHKGLKRLVTKGDRRVMEPDRLTDMIAFINAAVAFAARLLASTVLVLPSRRKTSV